MSVANEPLCTCPPARDIRDILFRTHWFKRHRETRSCIEPDKRHQFAWFAA
jgi:hypothetical protein